MRVEIPQTPRLQSLSAAWGRSPRPPGVVTPGPGQESVWDYPRPPAVEQVDPRAQVLLGNAVVADSSRCLRVLETASPPTIYFPADDVDQRLLELDHGTSHCEWKGAAVYFAVRYDQMLIRRAVWSYPKPLAEYAVLAGYFSFYPDRFTRCAYGDETVRPQPGVFYGGWVTSNLVGPFKGEPGSGGW